MNKITIIDAIKIVLAQKKDGMTVEEIYSTIVHQNLYSFKAKIPKNVVNTEIRRHCLGLDFPTAYPIKHFYIIKIVNGKPLYALLDKNKSIEMVRVKKEQIVDEEDELPEEKVEKTINNYNEKIKIHLMEKIMKNDPSFFEQLVIDLLAKMGYGYDKNAGLVVGGSHDGGIDGIISEDKLGLDLIYIQAKRYSKSNTVGRKDLQAFVGAMEGEEKGIFITTSSYSKEAKDYIGKLQHKHVRLIDGEALLEYMLRYNVGVQTLKEYRILKIDEEYFA